MIAGASAGDVQQLALCVVYILKVGLIGNGLDPLLERNDLIVASHYCDCPEFQTFGEMHGADGQPSNRRFDIFVEYIKASAASFAAALARSSSFSDRTKIAISCGRIPVFVRPVIHWLTALISALAVGNA